jgi:hypothetical protein
MAEKHLLVQFEVPNKQLGDATDKCTSFIHSHVPTFRGFGYEMQFKGAHDNDTVSCTVNFIQWAHSYDKKEYCLDCDFRGPGFGNLEVSADCLAQLLGNCHPYSGQKPEAFRLNVHGRLVPGDQVKKYINLFPSLKTLYLKCGREVARALLSKTKVAHGATTRIEYEMEEDRELREHPDLLQDLLPNGSILHNVYFPTGGGELQFVLSNKAILLAIGHLTAKITKSDRSKALEWYEGIWQILEHAVGNRQFKKLDIIVDDMIGYSAGQWKKTLKDAGRVGTVVFRCPNAREFIKAFEDTGESGIFKGATRLEFIGVTFVPQTLSLLQDVIKEREGSIKTIAFSVDSVGVQRTDTLKPFRNLLGRTGVDIVPVPQRPLM